MTYPSYDTDDSQFRPQPTYQPGAAPQPPQPPQPQAQPQPVYQPQPQAQPQPQPPAQPQAQPQPQPQFQPEPQPTSAPPTMAFPAQPSPAAPGYQPPYGYQPQPRPRGRTALIGLIVASVVLLILGGIGFGLYANERGKLRDTRADLTGQLTEQKQIAATRQQTIQEQQKKYTALDTEMTSTKATLNDVTEERDVLVPCMRRIQEAFDASAANDDQKAITALRQADAACTKAEERLND